MKCLIICLIFLTSTAVRAETLNSYIEKMKKVVENDGRCEFAVASVPKKDPEDQIFWPKRVACMGYLIFNKGTMKESKGCTAFFLNVNTLKITPLMNFGYNVVTNKECDSKGFEALMGDTMIKNCDNGKCTIDTVKLAFVTPYFAYNKPYEQLIVYRSSSQKHLEGWMKEQIKELDKKK